MAEPPSRDDEVFLDHLLALQTDVRALLDSMFADRDARRKAQERQHADVAQEAEVSTARLLQGQGLMRQHLDHLSEDLGRLNRDLRYVREDLTTIRRMLGSLMEQQAAVKRLPLEK